MPLQEGQLTKNFSKKEMACACCGVEKMDPHFMHMLQSLRELSGVIMRVSSGYRCEKHNEEVSTTGKTGPHTTGRAVDILVSGEVAFRLLKDALRLGFTGVGICQKGEKRYIHLDNLTSPEHPRPRVWSY